MESALQKKVTFKHILVLSTWLIVIVAMLAVDRNFGADSLDIKIFGYLVSLYLFVFLPPLFYFLYLIYDCFKTGKIFNTSNYSSEWVYRSEDPFGFHFNVIFYTLMLCAISFLVIDGCISKLD